MSLDTNALELIKALAENRIQDAKQAAIACCVNDNTKKNEGYCRYYKKLLENGSLKALEVPANLVGLLNLQDMSSFNEERYFLDSERAELFKSIEHGTDVSNKMLELGIHYMNSTLLHGEAGTGKTEFAKYVAYKLGLPYAYISFSQLIDSYLGNTSKNLQRVFDFCKGQKCVLMFDEIDCIALKRGKDGGVDGELGRTTIVLMQMLDTLVDGQIVIAATNRADRLDDAILRRFQRKAEFRRYDDTQQLTMMTQFLSSLDNVNPAWVSEDDKKELRKEITTYSHENHTQAEAISFLIQKIASLV